MKGMRHNISFRDPHTGFTVMLQAQTQKQQDAQAQLRSYVDAEIKAMHDRVSAQLRDSQLGLKTGLDAANRSLQDLKDALRYWAAFALASSDALVWQTCGCTPSALQLREPCRAPGIERWLLSVARRLLICSS